MYTLYYMGSQKQNKFHAWMPLSKSHDGGFVGILSDNSIDRDEEFMSKELLQSWASDSKSLPMLANHENKLEKLIGGWTEKKLIVKGDSSALVAKPFFLESNPLGKQAKAMVEEALAKGLNIGISIGAIPSGDMVEKEIDGKKFKGFSKAEILEATIVPIQSNRNASFTALAKSFEIDVVNDNSEVQKMSEELKKEEAPVAEPEVKEEAKPEEEAKSEEPSPQEVVDEANKELQNKVALLEKAIEKINKTSVNLPTSEQMLNAEQLAKQAEAKKDIDLNSLTVEKMLKLQVKGEL